MRQNEVFSGAEPSGVHNPYLDGIKISWWIKNFSVRDARFDEVEKNEDLLEKKKAFVLTE